MPPRLTRSPLESSDGVSPSHDEKARALLKREKTPGFNYKGKRSHCLYTLHTAQSFYATTPALVFSISGDFLFNRLFLCFKMAHFGYVVVEGIAGGRFRQLDRANPFPVGPCPFVLSFVVVVKFVIYVTMPDEKVCEPMLCPCQVFSHATRLFKPVNPCSKFFR